MTIVDTLLLSDAEDAGLPSADSDGSVRMILHQVNGDGAGYAHLL
jgi:hypothetical protein